jgi:hypothetical protein
MNTSIPSDLFCRLNVMKSCACLKVIHNMQ